MFPPLWLILWGLLWLLGCVMHSRVILVILFVPVPFYMIYLFFIHETPAEKELKQFIKDHPEQRWEKR